MYHGGEPRRSVACPHCGRQYKVRVTVRRHREFGVKRWFSIDGLRQYPCPCGTVFDVDEAVWRADQPAKSESSPGSAE